MSLKKIFQWLLSSGLAVMLFVSCGKDNDNNNDIERPVDNSIYTLAVGQEYQLESTIATIIEPDTAPPVNGVIRPVDSTIVNWECSTPGLVDIFVDTSFYVTEMGQNNGELVEILHITTVIGVKTLKSGSGSLSVDISYLKKGEWRTLRSDPRQITVKSYNNEAVRDSGVVISGVTWATRNVGTSGSFVANIEDMGQFYQWNSKIDWNGFPFALNTIMSSRNRRDSTAGSETWTKENTPCPEGWRMPTRDELQSLFNTSKKWGERNGVNGYLFFEGNNVLFLPAAGYLYERDGKPYLKGTNGSYWSNMTAIGSTNAYALNIADSEGNAHQNGIAEVGIDYGLSCRCVMIE